ncbi:hypothetical protein PGN35_028225 [Nodosilinea sp. PGN35]|uniref:hypothetical protein n=1 Tax=Nodosilinea sp. PGN35 TaxID=3020489 RepID=UPI0023B2179F|nr:hypothetical protein [Nodosilinea sp. TSF1-S3]MDF0365326.1 hypothetical protein [Nodosilinea sp. TSF1-S3]
MVSQLYYVLRSRADGSYLVARPHGESPPAQLRPSGFLLVFTADYDALSYLNAHAPELSDKFAIETVTASGLKPLINRWNFQGLGMVSDPRLPQVEFFDRS